MHYDQPYKPSSKEQREGRARRVGSKYSKVYIYDLLTEDTVDITKIDNLDDKSSLNQNVTGNSKARSEAIKKAMRQGGSIE